MKLIVFFLTIMTFMLVHTGNLLAAEKFSFTFKWGKLELCDSGDPNEVQNPIFTLLNVPKGTKTIEFEMTDLDKPFNNHGGGTVKYVGVNVIHRGAFNYNSPCPSVGTHTYQWTAIVRDSKGDKLAKVESNKVDYPK